MDFAGKLIATGLERYSPKTGEGFSMPYRI